MKQIIFATNNKHKLEEARAIIGDSFQVLSLDDIACTEELPETSSTLEGNAAQKAMFVHHRYNVSCFADDTGLEIEALDGEPGVFSARYAGEENNSERNMAKVLDKMEGVNNRRARFRTVIALIIDGELYQFEGIVNGSIAENKKGDNGFGYDPIFVPVGYDLSFAQLPIEVKNSISHRALAIEELSKSLINF